MREARQSWGCCAAARNRHRVHGRRRRRRRRRRHCRRRRRCRRRDARRRQTLGFRLMDHFSSLDSTLTYPSRVGEIRPLRRRPPSCTFETSIFRSRVSSLPPFLLEPSSPSPSSSYLSLSLSLTRILNASIPPSPLASRPAHPRCDELLLRAPRFREPVSRTLLGGLYRDRMKLDGRTLDLDISSGTTIVCKVDRGLRKPERESQANPFLWEDEGEQLYR